MSGSMMAAMTKHTITMMAFLEVQMNQMALFRMNLPLDCPAAGLNLLALPSD